MRFFTAAAMLTISGAYAFAQWVDDVPFIRKELSAADKIRADKEDEEAQASRNFAARYTCGNTAYEWVDDKTLRCTPRRGGKPYTVQAAQPPAAPQAGVQATP